MTVGQRLLRPVDWASLDRRARRAWSASLRPAEPEADVADIVEAVRTGGDGALRALTQRLDGADITSPWVDDGEFASAERRVPPELRDALAAAAGAIERYHAEQRNALRQERRVRTGTGVVAWRRWQPLERAGGYVPGGRAAYASSVLMLGIPARLAGVGELVVATPPDAEGRVADSILVAARIAGVGRILKAGGAQAIAALAFGTETIPAVDKIFGAGNAWVTAAKRAVSSEVAIDLPAGPSECVVLADGGADPELVALDLLAQAEHGPDSVAVLITDAPELIAAVEAELPQVAGRLATGERALATLQAWGASVLVPSIDDGLDAVDVVAAEHVSVQCTDADVVAARVRNAGAIFVGPWSPIAAGDYATGTNHVLPTGGAARAHGGVGVEAFGRWIEMQRLTLAGAARVSATVSAIAAAEGLDAHAASVVARAERAATAPPEADDALDLLRRPEPVAAYPAEPSDEELAARAGLRPAEVVRADMNTLGGGAIDPVREALARFDASRLAEYGDLAYARLRAAIGDRLGVDPAQVVPGAGADELIRLITTLVVGHGDAVVIPTPTFAMFAVEARLAGARVVELPRRDVAVRQPAGEIRRAAEESAARLVWLCTPNNPTGDAYDLAEMRELATGLPAIVCVDEVYLEFAETSTGAAPGSGSAIRLLDELPNVLVLRSMAKAYGLAGARVGHLVVPAPLAARFDAVRLPLSLSAPSEAAARAALAAEDDAVDRRREIVAQRDRLTVALTSLGCTVLPSLTNFVTFRPPSGGPAAAALDDALLRRGIALRRYDAGPMAGWLRATARLADENARVIAALEELLS